MPERSPAEDRELTLMERTMAQMAAQTVPPRPTAREDIRTRGQIEAATDTLKDALEEMTTQARESAYVTEERGLTIGEKGHQLRTGGAEEWAAPKVHPVWADALRHQTHIVRAMGEIGNQPEDWERDDTKWPAADPEWASRLTTAEDMRRRELPLEQRQAEHDARWAVIEQKLQGIEERNTAYFKQHPYSEEQLQQARAAQERDRQGLASMQTDGVLMLLDSVRPELAEGYVHDPQRWGEQRRFTEPERWPSTVQRFADLQQGDRLPTDPQTDLWKRYDAIQERVQRRTESRSQSPERSPAPEREQSREGGFEY